MTIAEHDMPSSAPGKQGRLREWRARWFGERDEVADQLADIARQGSGMARLAHVCASLMPVLFSAGSLVGRWVAMPCSASWMAHSKDMWISQLPSR